MINNLFVKIANLAAKFILKLYPVASTDNDLVLDIIRPSADETPDTPAVETLTASQELYKIAYENIGRHLSLNTAISPEVGCADTVSWLLLNTGYPIPAGGIPTVAGLTKWMLAQGFVEEKKYQTGFVITGRNSKSAHIGICGKEWIMSNTSFSDPKKELIAGAFQANYRLTNWKKVYPQTRYFRPVRSV